MCHHLKRANYYTGILSGGGGGGWCVAGEGGEGVDNWRQTMGATLKATSIGYFGFVVNMKSFTRDTLGENDTAST